MSDSYPTNIRLLIIKDDRHPPVFGRCLSSFFCLKNTNKKSMNYNKYLLKNDKTLLESTLKINNVRCFL